LKIAQRLSFIVLVSCFVAAAGAEWFAPAPYDKQFRDAPNAGASRRFLLGSDDLGRDRFSRLLHGARLSFFLAPAAALLATGLAAIAGALAGWRGGICDRALMSFADLLMSVPWIFLLLAVRCMLPLNTEPAVSVAATFLLLGSLGLAGPARAIRGGVSQMLRSPFVLHARASGAGNFRLLVFHVLPNLHPILAAQFWITVPAFILAEANLSLLGLGVSEPLPSLGNLLKELENVHAIRHHPAMLAPLLLLVVMLMCCRLAFPERPESA